MAGVCFFRGAGYEHRAPAGERKGAAIPSRNQSNRSVEYSPQATHARQHIIMVGLLLRWGHAPSAAVAAMPFLSPAPAARCSERCWSGAEPRRRRRGREGLPHRTSVAPIRRGRDGGQMPEAASIGAAQRRPHPAGRCHTAGRATSRDRILSRLVSVLRRGGASEARVCSAELCCLAHRVQ